MSAQEGGHWRACPTLPICRMHGKGGRNWHDLLRANWAKSGASSATLEPGRLPHCGLHGPLPMPCPALRSSSPWPWRSAVQKPPRRRLWKACSANCPQRSLVAGSQAITVRSGVCARDYGAPVRGGTRISQYPPHGANPQRQEAAFLPRPSYMETQQDINGKMRAILVDWLVEAEA